MKKFAAIDIVNYRKLHFVVFCVYFWLLCVTIVINAIGLKHL